MKTESKHNWAMKENVKTKNCVEVESGAWDPPPNPILVGDISAEIKHHIWQNILKA